MSTGMPLVSIVVPVYNGERFLRESLDSILAQDYSPVEVLVVDDASTDDTAAIIESYGDALVHVRQPRNRGIYENANEGIRRARGEYVAVYHADDVYLPHIVRREVEALRAAPRAGAVFCLDLFIDATGNEYGRLELPADLRGGGLLDFAATVNALLRHRNSFLRCPGAMVRAETYREVGLYHQQRWRNTSDLDMWLRIARARPILLLDEHLFRYRHFHGSSSGHYHHLRVEPDRFFPIMDHYLAGEAGTVARPDAVADYEGQRALDMLMRAASRYIRGELPEARGLIEEVRWSAIARGRTVQRSRLILLKGALDTLVRLPRSETAANAMYRRWHAVRLSG